MNHRHAGSREWLQWVVQPLSVLTKKYKGLVFGPLDDLTDEVFRDLAPEMVKAIGEQEIDEDVGEFIDGAREGRFEALDGLYRDPEPNQSEDYYSGYGWGFDHAREWGGKNLPAQVKREVVKNQIKEFREEVTEQVAIAAMESTWSAINPREIFQTVMRAVKQHGWKIGVLYAVGELIENIVLPAALSKITGVPVPPGSLAWLPLNDVVFAAVVKRLGRAGEVEFDPKGHLDWYEDTYGPVRLASVSVPRVARRYAFVSNPVVHLRDYLNIDDHGKGIDLVESYPHEFIEWLQANGYDDLADPEIRHTIEDGYADDPASLPKELVIEFFEHMEPSFMDHDADSPSWVFMDYVEVMKNQWMIHFTNDADAIACQGFKYGMDDYTRLGLTTHIRNTQKPGGYNFAYDVDEWERYAHGRHGFKYGKEAVLFRASGIKVWHHGDGEYQIVFVGNTAKDIVPLSEGGYDGGWWANGIGKGGREEGEAGSDQSDGSFESLSEAVDWVVANYNQYKSLLTC